MQRIHGWFDQLTLRRSRRSRTNEARESRRATSQSAAPVTRREKERHLKPVAIPFISAPIPQSLTSSLTSKSRKGIRTNPWLYTSYPPPTGAAGQCDLDCRSLDRRRPPTLGVSRLDESSCSSGYGSQDCSPDSSIHTNWQQVGTWSSESYRASKHDRWPDVDTIDDGCFLEESSSYSAYDNICDEHVYHELEAICRRPDRSYSSDCLSCDSPQPRADSPIYAQPWAHWPTAFDHQRPPPTTAPPEPPRRRLPQRPSSPIYATPYESPREVASFPRSFISRLERQHNKLGCVPNTMEEAEREFLSELDAQINELQQRSDELRLLVERARVRRGVSTWTRPHLECTFELEL